jgi:hypothetical protein
MGLDSELQDPNISSIWEIQGLKQIDQNVSGHLLMVIYVNCATLINYYE